MTRQEMHTLAEQLSRTEDWAASTHQLVSQLLDEYQDELMLREQYFTELQSWREVARSVGAVDPHALSLHLDETREA